MNTMSMTFGRTDTSTIARWWWTIDRWILAGIALLVVIGAFLTMAASPAVAERIGVQSFHFVHRQFIFVLPGLAIILGISLLSPLKVRRLASIVFLVSLVLTALTLIVGTEIKGATRWLNLGGLSIQPSEFLKPAFAVVAAWMFAEGRLDETFRGNLISMVLFAMVVTVLVFQPDIGMTLVVAAVWGAQFFLAGLQLFWVFLLGALGLGALVVAYFLFGHVQDRVDRFMGAGDNFQVTTALNAFKNGGVMGVGPGEGSIKLILPDAHTDFIMAVAGEEFGIIACLAILALFGFIVLRGFARMLKEDDIFVLLATSGLLVQFGLQAVINMASTLHLIPTKGMTLPFISYGGSSMLGLAFGMGMVLALTRQRIGKASPSIGKGGLTGS